VENTLPAWKMESLSSGEMEEWKQLGAMDPRQGQPKGRGQKSDRSKDQKKMKEHGKAVASFIQKLSPAKRLFIKKMKSDLKEEQKRLKALKATKADTGESTWSRCMFWKTHQRRYCGMERVDGANFCGVHVNDGDFGAAGERIPCPLDPSHSIYKKNLQTHLKICNRKRGRDEMEAQPYFSKDINSGSNAVDSSGPIAPNSVVDIDQLVLRVRQCYKKHVGIMLDTVEQLSPDICRPLFEAASAVGTEFRKQRHVLQQASIVGHMQRRSILSTDATYVEFGAGRGMLALAIDKALRHQQSQTSSDNLDRGAALGVKVVMVERGSVKHKADKHFKGWSGTTLTGKQGDGQDGQDERFYRARVDIRDFDMRGVPMVCIHRDLVNEQTRTGVIQFRVSISMHAYHHAHHLCCSMHAYHHAHHLCCSRSFSHAPVVTAMLTTAMVVLCVAMLK
jgi:hypothetical protein